ncbi:MAG: TRAP transporter small permease [Desulfobacteraceae bacterium]|jgi:TRAP-type C4-dicarboxylate transport system permease small subunit
MLERFEKILVVANKAAIGFMMGVMFVLVFVNVVARYCFGFSFMTAEEISTFLMIWITYLGAGLALREGRHAAIDLFQDLLPVQIRRALRATLGILIVLFFATLTYYGIRLSQFAWGQETMATQIPKGIPYLAVPVGALVIVLHLVLMFREWIDKRWEEILTKDESDMIEGETL